MLKRMAAAVLALAAVVAGSNMASAATTHKTRNHTLTATLKVTPLSSQGNPPISGSRHEAGSATSNYGSGAIVQTTTYGPPGQFKTTGTAYGRHGSYRYTLTGTGSADAQGNFTLSGTGKIPGGTDTFHGAKGTLTFTGDSPNGSTVATVQVRGKIKY